MIALLGKITGFFSTYLLDLALAVIVALALWGGVQTHRVTLAEAKTVKVQNAWDLDKAQRTQVALAAQTAFRAKEQGWQAQLTKAQGDYDALRTQDAQKLAAYAASSRAALADNGKLRGQLAAFAAGGGAAGQDTVAAASGRAAALGLLLADALRLDDEALLAGSESAGAAESTGNAVRTLLKAWPHDDDSTSLGKLKLGS